MGYARHIPSGKENMKDLQVVEYSDQRILTTQQIADAYEADTRLVITNFNRNKERYTEGKHYFFLEGDALKNFLTTYQNDMKSRVPSLYLWTRRGAFMHAKSLNTDKAWEVYENLVDDYFDKREESQQSLRAPGSLDLDLIQQRIATGEEQKFLWNADLKNWRKLERKALRPLPEPKPKVLPEPKPVKALPAPRPTLDDVVMHVLICRMNPGEMLNSRKISQKGAMTLREAGSEATRALLDELHT